MIANRLAGARDLDRCSTRVTNQLSSPYLVHR